jgi:multiple sugar transport system ATP-binding protein
MKDGVLQQVDTPTGIYNRPANTFVAAFIGSPTMNLYHAEAEGEALRLGSTRLTLPPEASARIRAHGKAELIVGIRPEDISDAATLPDRDPGREIEGRAELVEELGSDILVHLAVDARAAEVRSSDSLDQMKAGDGASRCIARFTAKSRVRMGDRVTARVDTGRLHLFDAATGATLSP